MLDELLREIGNISNELKEHYDAENEFYQKAKSFTQDNVIQLERIRDDKSIDFNERCLASVANISEARTMAIFSSYMIAINILTRLSIRIEQSMTAIVNELTLLKQQKAMPLAEEKINEIEKQLTKLNKEFGKYSPTLRKFKQALDQTEKILRDNK